MNSKKRPLWLRVLPAAGFFLLCAAWLFMAMVLWDGGRFSWNYQAIWPKTGTLPIARNLPRDAFLADVSKRFSDSMGRGSIAIYLCLTPFPCWAFTLGVLLPDTLRRLFPRREKLLCVYRIFAAPGILFGLVCMLAGCTTLLRAFLSRPAETGLARIHMALIPASAALAVLGWLLPCALLRLRETAKEKSLLRESGIGLLRCGLSLACAFLATVASCLLLAALRPLAPDAVRSVERFCTNNARFQTLAFISVVQAPIMEELAFRGLIQRGLRRSLPAWAAIGLAALFFGLWHRNTGQFVYTFLFALVVGTVYERTGKLRYTVLIHFLMNVLAILGFSDRRDAVFGRMRFMPWLGNRLLGLPAWAAVLLLLAVLASLVFLLRGFRAKETSAG